jgi:hypothetical protein
LNISAYPSENFGLTIMQNAEAIRHLWHVNVPEMGVSHGFGPSNTARCLYADRIDDNRVALVARQTKELDLIPHRHGATHFC